MTRQQLLRKLTALVLLATPAPAAADKAPVRVEVTDADTKKPIPARVYLQGPDGAWHFPRSEAARGSVVLYQRPQRRDRPGSSEMHATISAHPVRYEVPPGRYTLTVERGKEYLPQTIAVTVGREATQIDVKLQRWIDLA